MQGYIRGMDVENLIRRAYWLTDGQRQIFAEAMTDTRLLGLSESDRFKLAGLVCSTPYAEQAFYVHGKPLLGKIKRLLIRLRLNTFFCRSIGTWNINVCHAERFGYSSDEFKRLLQNDDKAVRIVIDLILNHIGLEKPLDHIFGEYNINIMATTIAALQRAMNILMKKYGQPITIQENGHITEKTRAAVELSNQLLKRPLGITSWNELNICSALDRLAEEEGIRVAPFVPGIHFRMDFGFVKKILKKSLRKPSALKKLLMVFHNHINVPLYVRLGMDAYAYLSSTSLNFEPRHIPQHLFEEM